MIRDVPGGKNVFFDQKFSKSLDLKCWLSRLEREAFWGQDMNVKLRSAAAMAAITFVLGQAGISLAQGQPNPGAATTAAAPAAAGDGTVHVPAFDLPPSGYLSKEALEFQKMIMRAMASGAMGRPDTNRSIVEARAGMERQLGFMVDFMRKKYPANVADQTIAGVKTRVFTPLDGKFDPQRILINLHGGAFSMCAEACAYLESLPLASLGGFKVISVDYRQAPEYVHPAASEDVAAVYKDLLKSYKPSQIGIYGCSAGGALAGMAAAWLPSHGLPQAGAIGIFGAGAGRFQRGDSVYAGAAFTGQKPPVPGAPPAPMSVGRSYFEGADMDDPMVSPDVHPDVLAKFPPTLVITGGRAFDFSPAINTHSKLLKAGVDSNLLVGEGLGHCYIYMPLPEAYDAHQVEVNFFRKHLGR